MKKLMSRMAVAGVVALVVGCGTTPPTATFPNPAEDGGMATASASRVSPAECRADLMLREKDAGKGWVRLEAFFFDVKSRQIDCGGVEFSITPYAELHSPRFDPNQVIVTGKPGMYALTASTPYAKPVSTKVEIQ